MTVGKKEIHLKKDTLGDNQTLPRVSIAMEVDVKVTFRNSNIVTLKIVTQKKESKTLETTRN